jgi:hypothetical protein
MDDLLWEFLGYDFAMSADMVKCPYCGADVPCSLIFDDKVKCTECGKDCTKNEPNLTQIISNKQFTTPQHSVGPSLQGEKSGPT